ncbi:MAG: 3D domain-containing protein [Chloroflexi bacterium]|nr:3D domain-containing protein [Chloroflexota bacterium]
MKILKSRADLLRQRARERRLAEWTALMEPSHQTLFAIGIVLLAIGLIALVIWFCAVINMQPATVPVSVPPDSGAPSLDSTNNASGCGVDGHAHEAMAHRQTVRWFRARKQDMGSARNCPQERNASMESVSIPASHSHNIPRQRVVSEVGPGRTVGCSGSPAPQLYRVTAYCPCKLCCGPKARGITASGTRADHPLVAAPPEIPFGTVLDIPGYGRVKAEDRGGAIKGLRLDVLFPTHKDALQWGVQYLAVASQGE